MAAPVLEASLTSPAGDTFLLKVQFNRKTQDRNLKKTSMHGTPDNFMVDSLTYFEEWGLKIIYTGPNSLVNYFELQDAVRDDSGSGTGVWTLTLTGRATVSGTVQRIAMSHRSSRKNKIEGELTFWRADNLKKISQG